MKTIQILIACGCLLLAGWLAQSAVNAATTSPAGDSAKGSYINPDWKAAGLRRSGTVWIPKDESKRPKNGWPCVFVFHGHGGSDRTAMRGFAIEQCWPDAVVIYPKGLPTKGLLTDPDGNRSGWDMSSKADENRDVSLFDVILEWAVKEQHIDPNRVYSTGHSNGGGFTYTLWGYRGDKLAGVAPSAAAAYRTMDLMKPKPAMIIGGKNDPLVKFSWQEGMIKYAKKINQCNEKGKEWGPDATWYDSPTGNPVVALVHDGGHEMAKNAGKRIAEFFQQVEKKAEKK